MDQNQKSLEYALRWVFVICGIACFVAGLWWVYQGGLAGTILGAIYYIDEELFDPNDGPVFTVVVMFFMILFTQWLFLRPRKTFKMNLTQKGKPLKSAIVVAGFMGALLTSGLIYTAMQLTGWWKRLSDNQDLVFDNDNNGQFFWMLFIGLLLIFWIVWGIIFTIHWYYGDRYTQLRRMTAALFAGSILELFIAGPVQAFSDPDNSCYCSKGSYSGLVLGATVAVWAFGPLVFLLFLEKSYRAQKIKELTVLRASDPGADPSLNPPEALAEDPAATLPESASEE